MALHFASGHERTTILIDESGSIQHGFKHPRSIAIAGEIVSKVVDLPDLSVSWSISI